MKSTCLSLPDRFGRIYPCTFITNEKRAKWPRDFFANFSQRTKNQMRVCVCVSSILERRILFIVSHSVVWMPGNFTLTGTMNFQINSIKMKGGSLFFSRAVSFNLQIYRVGLQGDATHVCISWVWICWSKKSKNKLPFCCCSHGCLSRIKLV